MAVLRSLFLLSLVVVSSLAQTGRIDSRNNPYGSIQGTVLTEEGLPVVGATVYLFSNGMSPVTTTGNAGEFLFQNVKVGNQKIIAYKEADGFPNTVWSFYSETYGQKGMQLVSVYGDGQVTKVAVKLGPRAGRLLIHLIDADTTHPIKGGTVVMTNKGRPKTLLKSGSNTPDGFDVLIPPNIPVEVTITAIGYQPWQYHERGKDTIRLTSGAKREIIAIMHH